MSASSLIVWREYLRLAADSDLPRWLTLICEPGGFMELRLMVDSRAKSVNAIFGDGSHRWLLNEIDDCRDEGCLRGLMLVALETEQHRRARAAIKEQEWYQSPMPEGHDVCRMPVESVSV